MKYAQILCLLFLLIAQAPRAIAQDGDTISAAQVFSSMFDDTSSQGNAADFQNSAPRPDWGNPIFGEQLITVSHGAAIFQRQQDNDSLLPLNGTAGLELDAVLHLHNLKLEFGWLGVFSGNATQYLPALNGDSLPTNPPIFFFGGFFSQGLISTQYSSELDSFEFNLRQPFTDRFTGILGLRYINLHETVHLEEKSAFQVLGWKTITSNNLFGIQAGGDFTVARSGRFEMNAIGKAGIYVNSIDQEGMIVGFPAPGVVQVDDSTARAAFLGEIKLLGTYHFTDYFAVSAGYQALWFYNLALGQNQFSAINLTSGSGIHASAAPLYHGAIIQGVVSW